VTVDAGFGLIAPDASYGYCIDFGNGGCASLIRPTQIYTAALGRRADKPKAHPPLP
jgi:hypothetical protein